jgi:transcriptional repressor NrdR
MTCVHCPLCEAATRVLESRSPEAGDSIRRRRECSACGHRFTTYERYEQSLFVRKRNGRREPFDREKLRSGLVRAAHKRPVPETEIDAIVDSIQAAVIETDSELPTSAIGELCLNGLRGVDQGAYLQFAGTLPSQDHSMIDASSEFAGSLPTGSVRSESNPSKFTPRSG